MDDNSSVEDYISSLKIWCENDIEIVIQEPGQKARTLSHFHVDRMGLFGVFGLNFNQK